MFSHQVYVVFAAVCTLLWKAVAATRLAPCLMKMVSLRSLSITGSKDLDRALFDVAASEMPPRMCCSFGISSSLDHGDTRLWHLNVAIAKEWARENLRKICAALPQGASCECYDTNKPHLLICEYVQGECLPGKGFLGNA